MSFLKDLFKRLFKKVRWTTLLIFAILLSGNIFAWFIYTTKIDSTISAHVKAWNIDFVIGNTSLSQEVNFDITDLYPGMSNYTEDISVTNSGETSARLSFEILSARVLNTNYVVDGVNLTSDQLINQLANDYPFKISLSVDNATISPYGGHSSFMLNVTWPYESGDDELDTYWGNGAYSYYLNHNEPIISLVVKISATQV